MKTRLVQLQSDPLWCRISVGGHDDLGYYCIFSGDREEAAECLRQVLNALEDPTHPVEVHSND